MSIEIWSRVYTVNEYYDGPERGVADFRGDPHIYQKQFSEADGEYTSCFLLSRIEPDLLLFVLEDWEIWLRWDAAYRQGKVDVKTHPALPEERSRHEEIKQAIGDRFKADLEKGVIRWARFRVVSGEIEVQWLDAPPESLDIP